jgi:hypothetical protein
VRTNWFIAAIGVGIAAIVVAAVAMRLSDDGSPTTEEWAGSVCTSLADWRESIASLADPGGEPPTAASIREKLGDASDATSDLVTQLRDLGPPDLDSGDQLQEQLDASVSDLESSFGSLKSGVEEAADAPLSDFLQQLAALAPDLAALQTAASGVVTTLQNADLAEGSKTELQQAFADAPSCESLRNES